MDALLSIKIGVGETLRSYANRYWELYNKIGGGNEKIAAGTFRIGLLEFRAAGIIVKKASRGYEATHETY